MLEPFVLEGTYVRLEPLAATHVEGLVAAAAEDPSIYRWSSTPRHPEEIRDYVAEAREKAAQGVQVAFATVRKGDGDAGRIVGATRFYDISFWRWPRGSVHQRRGVPDVVDIGYTWLAASARRSPVNTEAKLLMMTHAFEVWRVHRVALQTDVRNLPSRAAIERIGAQLDGIMRADRPGMDDTVRTGARYSITIAEWPEVKARMTTRLHGGGQ